MGLVRYGGGIAQISGSIAGNTFARNRFGNYVRNRTMPVNPNTALQSAVRSAMAAVTEMWYTQLSDAQRTAWATYAAAVKVKNRLGEDVYLTGFNHFIRSAMAIKTVGGTVVEDAPTTLELPETDDNIVATYDESATSLSLAYTTGLAYLSEVGGYMAIFMGQPQIGTRNFFKGPWRYIGCVTGAASPPASPKLITTPPFTITEGQKIWTKARIIRADGRVSNEFYAAPVDAVA